MTSMHSVTIFEAYPKNPQQFLKCYFSHFRPHFWLIFLQKETFYFRIQKYYGVRNQNNSHLRKVFNCI